MKLYLQQKVFSFTTQFSIKDEIGNDKYFVKGELISLGKRLHLLNASNQEIALVAQQLLTFLPKFKVFVNNFEVAEIVKEFTILKPKYKINGLNWTIDGDFFGHDYQILNGGSPIVSIHKKWMSWGDSYEVEIVPGTDEIMALAVVLAIDSVLESEESSRSHSNY
ncbi:MAG: LURP-one-related family protein [bacterium]